MATEAEIEAAIESFRSTRSAFSRLRQERQQQLAIRDSAVQRINDLQSLIGAAQTEAQSAQATLKALL